MNNANLPPFVHIEEASGRVWLDIGVTPPGDIDKQPLYRGQGFSEYIWNPFPEYPDVHWYKSNLPQTRDRFGRINTPVPQGAWALGYKNVSSHGGLRGALSNFWEGFKETLATAIRTWATAFSIANIFSGGAVSSALGSETAATAASTEGASTMELTNWTDFGSASDAAVASNVVSEPSFWDRLTGIGERALEFGVKQAISKEIFGDNQQPISTRAVAAQTPVNNALPQRGFQSNVPYFRPATSADMSPFIWLAAGFGIVLVLILGFSRR